MATPAEIREIAQIINQNMERVIHNGDRHLTWVGGLISRLAKFETDDQITEELSAQVLDADSMISYFMSQLPDLFPRD